MIDRDAVCPGCGCFRDRCACDLREQSRARCPTARGLRPVAELGANRPHGTRLRYLSGCKCFRCRRANSDYERQRQAARLAGDWNGIVDAARARAHLVKLARAGVGRRVVGDVTDISDSILHEIRHRRRLRIRARTERKILAVTAKMRADHSFVPAAKAWRLIGELIDEGFTKSAIAKEMGYRGRGLQLRHDRITVRNEQRVVALHRRLTT
jgi:hypothetical protein